MVILALEVKLEFLDFANGWSRVLKCFYSSFLCRSPIHYFSIIPITFHKISSEIIQESKAISYLKFGLNCYILVREIPLSSSEMWVIADPLCMCKGQKKRKEKKERQSLVLWACCNTQWNFLLKCNYVTWTHFHTFIAPVWEIENNHLCEFLKFI